MTTLYRIYGARRELIYVGITDTYEQRMRHHSEKYWWREVRNIETEEFSDRGAAMEAEATCIRQESPKFNIAHNAPAESRPRATVPRANSTGKRQWLTQDEAADYLGITDRTVRRMIAAGDLPAYRLGKRSLRIDAKDVDALLRPIPTAGRWQS